MILLLSGILLFIAFLSADILWSFKRNEFMEHEAKRCLGNMCEIEDSWSSGDKFYTYGFTIIRENGKNRFVKQTKLYGSSLLCGGNQ